MRGQSVHAPPLHTASGCFLLRSVDEYCLRLITPVCPGPDRTRVSPFTINVKHARYYWLLLTEGNLTRSLFGAILRRLTALSVPAGQRQLSLLRTRAATRTGSGSGVREIGCECSRAKHRGLMRKRTCLRESCRGVSERRTGLGSFDGRSCGIKMEIPNENPGKPF